MQRAALDLGVTGRAPMSRVLKMASEAERSDVYGVTVPITQDDREEVRRITRLTLEIANNEQEPDVR